VNDDFRTVAQAIDRVQDQAAGEVTNNDSFGSFQKGGVSLYGTSEIIGKLDIASSSLCSSAKANSCPLNSATSVTPSDLLEVNVGQNGSTASQGITITGDVDYLGLALNNTASANDAWFINSFSGGVTGPGLYFTAAAVGNLPTMILTAPTSPDNGTGGVDMVGAVSISGSLAVSGALTVSGKKQFVQDDPEDPTKQIVYVALEGGEAGTYARGTAHLRNGAATISLPHDFTLVTGEGGITVQLTPSDECQGWVAVAHKNAQQIQLHEHGGSSDCDVDYMVNGIRKGFENHQVIQERPLEKLKP
jgi:hypothetical protein